MSAAGIPFGSIAEPVARRLLGEPNRSLSTRKQLRFGTRGSLSVEIAGGKAGTWHDHEAGQGGGVLDLIARETKRTNGEAVDWLREHGFIEAEPAQKPQRRIVATYDYHDGDGGLLFQVCRFDPKDFRQRRPDGAGGWVWNLQGVDPVLYWLPELRQAARDATVYVVEGEKDADALRDRLLVATCNPGGAGKWRDSYSEALRGRRVVILPDRDEAGEKHAQDVAAKLHGIAQSVRVLRLPGLPSKGDVSDWLAAGGTADDLDRLAADTPEWQADAASDADGADDLPLPVLYAADIKPVLDTADFVQGTLVERSAAVIYGESNSGKTFFATDLALSVAAGISWNGRQVEQGGVIYCVLEGGFGFRNRVTAWISDHGVDPTRLPFAAIPASINLLDPEADTQKLIDTIKAVAAKSGFPVKLVVIDTLSRALAGGNENASEDMGALVVNMDRIRAETDATVLFIHHSGKDQARGARGHSLLRAAIDTEIEVVDQNGARVASVVKQRDLPKGDAFGFRLKVIEVGTDRRGNPVTTCVVEPAEVVKRRDRMSASETAALKVLSDVIAAEGLPLPGLSGFPSGLSGVSEIRWRDECDARRIPSNAEKKDSRDKAFRRAFTGLQAANAVGARDGLVWIARQDGEA